ncbi:hypothetical protein DZS_04630 [Dickeya ananatis]
MSLISRVMSRAAPTASGDIRQIVALAWPMMVTAVVVSLSQNMQIAILGNGAESQTLLTLSFFTAVQLSLYRYSGMSGDH